MPHTHIDDTHTHIGMTHAHTHCQDLKERTLQPETHLKAILTNICDFELTGDNKGKYQLKEDIR